MLKFIFKLCLIITKGKHKINKINKLMRLSIYIGLIKIVSIEIKIKHLKIKDNSNNMIPEIKNSKETFLSNKKLN